jgi:hypothetical protein
MRNMHKIFLILLMSAGLSPAFANDIYITQSGAGLNLDLIQDGQNNVMGTTSARMTLTGTTSVLYASQTGNTNALTLDLEGTSLNANIVATGDSNDIVLKCNAGSSSSYCDNWTADIDIIGDSGNIDIDVGTTAASSASNVVLQATGDSTTVNLDIDGASAPVSITAVGNLNNFQVNLDGPGDSNGHQITIHHTGNSATYDVVQSGAYDSILDIITNTGSGAAADVDISQTQ